MGIKGEQHPEKIIELINTNFDLRPTGIIRSLDLRRPIYRQTAAYGHFGRTDLDFTLGKNKQSNYTLGACQLHGFAICIAALFLKNGEGVKSAFTSVDFTLLFLLGIE